MAVPIITESEFDEKVLKSPIPVMVDFYADWCAPCKMAEPVLEELMEENKGKVSITKMNVDESKDTPPKYSILSIPTTVMINKGEEVGRQSGFAGRKAYEVLIEKVK